MIKKLQKRISVFSVHSLTLFSGELTCVSDFVLNSFLTLCVVSATYLKGVVKFL